MEERHHVYHLFSLSQNTDQSCNSWNICYFRVCYFLCFEQWFPPQLNCHTIPLNLKCICISKLNTTKKIPIWKFSNNRVGGSGSFTLDAVNLAQPGSSASAQLSKCKSELRHGNSTMSSHPRHCSSQICFLKTLQTFFRPHLPTVEYIVLHHFPWKTTP